MSSGPDISFYIPGHNGPVGPDSPLWDMPLSGKKIPAGREGQAGKPAAAGSAFQKHDQAVTVGEYFLAARNFLVRDNSQMLYRAVTSLAGSCSRIETLAVSLEKHGAFYHPLKITIETRSCSPLYLVLNGAVKNPGRALIKTEYQLLADMAFQVVPSFIPRVFGAGDTRLGPHKAAFFLGEWFAGFREFHVTRTPEGDQVAVWQDDGTHMAVPWRSAARLYEKIAYILTAYYDLSSGHAIYPWHHAAGDFVVAGENRQACDVRLVTVRGTAPLPDMALQPSAPEANLLSCLLFYFLNLTLRMRLDRMDGTGAMVFLPRIVLDAAIKGVCTALDHRAKGILKTGAGRPPVPENLCPVFMDFTKGFSQTQLVDISANIVERWPRHTAELALVHENLFSHCAGICRVLKQPGPDFPGQRMKNR